MKRFVIKPARGRTTVTLRGQKYFNKSEAAAVGKERGTQPIYLGSFSSNLDPRRLEGVERIGPGDKSHGITVKSVMLDDGPFELSATDVQEIREWLMANGSWARAQKSIEQYQASQARAKAEERAQLEVQLRAELTAQLRPQIQAEVEKAIEARRRHPLVDAVAALEAAGAAVRDEAERLTLAGHRLTARRGKGVGHQDLAVAELLDRTLALRIKAFGDFEAACKSAGLMAGRRTSPAKGKGSMAR